MYYCIVIVGKPFSFNVFVSRFYTNNNSCICNNHIIVDKHVSTIIGYVIINGLFVWIAILPLLTAILFSLLNSLK